MGLCLAALSLFKVLLRTISYLLESPRWVILLLVGYGILHLINIELTVD